VSAVSLPFSPMTTTLPLADLADEELARRARAGSAAHFEDSKSWFAASRSRSCAS
jgi:hypothetical protein